MEPHQAVRRSLSLFLLWFLANSIIFAALLELIGITILYAVLIAIFLSTTTTVLAYRRMELLSLIHI